MPTSALPFPETIPIRRCAGAEEQHRDASESRISPQRACELDTCLARHHVISDHQIRRYRPCELQRFHAVVSGKTFVTETAYDVAVAFEQCGLIFSDQNFAHRHVPVAAPFERPRSAGLPRNSMDRGL
jgi:hypothetical protein